MNENYLIDIKKHLKNDIKKLKNEYEFNEFGSIEIEKAGKETHCGGKVALYLIFNINKDEKIELVYKPRSLLPDFYLENAMEKVTKIKRRKILCCEDHGYDFKIKGKPPKKLTDIVNKEISKVSHNAQLILVLKILGIEDTHPDNFLIDDDNNLHCIDAEVHHTKIALNLNELCSAVYGKDLESESQKCEQVINEEKSELENLPTRLVICSTHYFNKSEDVTFSYLPSFQFNLLSTIGEKIKVKVKMNSETWEMKNILKKYSISKECKIINKENNNKNNDDIKLFVYHVFGLAQFLLNNNFMDIKDILEDHKSKKIIVFDNLIDKLCEIALGSLTIIYDGIFESQKYGSNEVLSFHYFFDEGKIICDITHKEFIIKKKDNI